MKGFLIIFIFSIYFKSQNISEAGKKIIHYCLICFISNNMMMESIANWAQASGKLKQNIVIPYIPAPNQPHWTPRYGATAVVLGNETVINYIVVIESC